MTVNTGTTVRTMRSGRPADRRLMHGALAVALISGVPFAALSVAAPLTPHAQHFRHTADYWYTGLGVPYLLAALVLVIVVHRAHRGSDGRLGRAGAATTAGALVVMIPLLPAAMIAGNDDIGLGPLYPVLAFLADAGMLLLTIGMLRARWLPRTLVLAWFVGWFLGGALGPQTLAPLLVVVYVALALLLPRYVNHGDETP